MEGLSIAKRRRDEDASHLVAKNGNWKNTRVCVKKLSYIGIKASYDINYSNNSKSFSLFFEN